MKCLVSIFTILFSAFFLSAEEINIDSLIRKIDEGWNRVNDYTCAMKTYSKQGEKEEEKTIKHKFLKPKWIYMKTIEGDGKGSVGIYNPITKKVKGHKGGLLKMIVLTLDLTDKRVASLRGHRIDQGDCGTLINRLREYTKKREFISVTKTVFLEKPAYLFIAEVADTTRLWGAQKEKLWIDCKNLFPLRIEQLAKSDEIVHYSTFNDIKINIGLTEKDFEF